jgi:hypothetical protein
VQGIEDRVTPALLTGVTGGQEYNDIAVDGVAFQIAFQCGAVNLDALLRYGFRTGHGGRHLGLDLRK